MLVQVGADAFEGLFRRHVPHHAHVYLRLRLVRDDRLRSLLPVPANDAVDIQRWLVEILAQQFDAVKVVLEALHLVAA